MLNFLISYLSLYLPNFNLYVALLCLIVYAIYKKLTNDKQTLWSEQGLPTASINKLELLLLSHPDIQLKWARKYGKLFGTYDSSTPVLNCAEPKLLKLILSKDFHVFTNHRRYPNYNEVSRRFLLFLEDDDWRRVRSVISPTFSTSKIKKMLSLINDSVDEMLQNFDKLIKGKKSLVDIKKVFEVFALQVNLEVGYGTKVHSLYESNNPVTTFARKFFVSLRILILLLFPSFFKLFRMSFFEASSLDFFKNFAMRIVTERRKRDSKSKTTKRSDFLQLLIDGLENSGTLHSESGKYSDFTRQWEQLNHQNKIELTVNQNKSLTIDEFISQSSMFFFAGFDQIVSLLCYTVYNLAHHPEVQDKLYQEVKEAIINNDELDVAAINSLKYLDAVINETLRLHPPTPFLDRVASEDYVLNDKLKIPKNTVVEIPIAALHRDPDYWEDPDQFKPERFFPENRRFHPYAYLPFGAGPRCCIGVRWALIKVKLALVHTVYNFRFSPDPFDTDKPYFSQCLKPFLATKISRLVMESRV